jgi:nicotinamidase/pyrazinamidase
LVSPNTIFWEVDAQADFMLPGGKLYVPGAEKIISNVNRLVEAARQGRVFLVSSADAHHKDDAELRNWPAHCLIGTPGAELLPEARAANRLIIPNERNFALPRDLSCFQQVTLEKNTLDVFDNPNTEKLLAQLGPAGLPSFAADAEFVVFGVATEYCVQYAAEGLQRRGRRVAIVTNTVRAIETERGDQALKKLQSRGVRLICIEEALALTGTSSAAPA